MSETPSKLAPETTVRIVLLALSAAFVAFGIAFLIYPAKLAAYVDIEAKTRLALIELRAFYGGIELGFGVFLAAAALRKAWQTPALVAAILMLAGVVGARIYGISVEGVPGPFVFVLLLLELAGLVAAIFGLSQARRAEAEVSAADLDKSLRELEAEKGVGRVIEKTRPIERTRVIDKTEKLRLTDE